MTYAMSKELVACTKTRSVARSAPVGVVVQLTYPVLLAEMLFCANEQYPKTMPLIVGADGSSPTFSDDVLAVPRIFTVLPAVAMETVPFVLFEITSSF